jgi:amino acid transporter
MAITTSEPIEPAAPELPGSRSTEEPRRPGSGRAGAPRVGGRRADVANLVLGRRLRSDQDIHQRLDNPTALAVFASDALSSVAYATEEMLTKLLPYAAVAAFGMLMPLSIGIVALLVILIFSYRQTIKAYPSAGGAYIVTRDNFGVLPAQVAGVALLTDYILTVAVSVSAGVAAAYSAFPELRSERVLITVVLIWFIALMNLRGVKESGRIFAVPTYGFVLAIFGLLVVGLVRQLVGGLHAANTHAQVAHAGGVGTLGIFVILTAFASGCTAMTGVEAISNGVPAFKPVEYKNARKVLGVLGLLLGTMFLGISYLAVQIKPIPTSKQTVISQIARAVLGTGTVGHFLYFVVQILTMLILVLAANTSFADFPRLASFHAHDHFLPTPMTTRGRRLVFSTGIIVLAAFATLMTLVTGASVTRLIPLYAIGVFTSFTLSQAGMARRHTKLKEPGWHVGILVNGLGAIATAVVLVVIAVTKFLDGAWIIMLAVPIIVVLLTRVNKHYLHITTTLADEAKQSPIAPSKHLDTVVFVSKLDVGLDRAMRYLEALPSDSVRCVHIGPESKALAGAFWARYERELEFVEGRRIVQTARQLAHSEREAHPDRVVAIVIPEMIDDTRWRHLLRYSTALRLKAGLLLEPGVVVVNVPTMAEDKTLRNRPARNHVALVPIGELHAGARDALAIAALLGADRVVGVHIAESTEGAEEVQNDWEAAALKSPLELVAAPYRTVAQPLLDEVRALKREGAELVTVVIGEVVPKWYQHGLHNHRALQMKAGLLFEPGVATVSVPHHL